MRIVVNLMFGLQVATVFGLRGRSFHLMSGAGVQLDASTDISSLNGSTLRVVATTADACGSNNIDGSSCRYFIGPLLISPASIDLSFYANSSD